MPEDGTTKVCPLCAETIKAAAKICPHCRKAQNRWLFFVSRFDFFAVCAMIVLPGLVWLLVQLLTPIKSFARYQNQIQILSSTFSVHRSSDSTNLVVDGTLTNESDYAWRVGEFEVRYFGKDGQVADVLHGEDNFEVLPHAEHTYHFEEYNMTAFPDYPNNKTLIRSASDPRTYDFF